MLSGTVMNILRIFLLTCAITVAVPANSECAGDIVRIGGMGSGLGVMKILGTAFEKKNPGTKVQVLPSLGSTGGIKAVAKGALDIGVSARPVKDEEKNYGLVSAEYAETPFVIVTRKDTSASGLSTEDLVRIYDGRLRTWEDGRRIRPVLRPEEDMDTHLVKRLSPEMYKAMDAAMSSEGMVRAVTDQDASNAVEKTPGAIGFSTLGQVITEKRPLKILSLNGILPTASALSNGSYKLKKKLFIITRPGSSVKVRSFLDFVKSPAGSKILAESGFIVNLQKTGQ